MGLSRVRRVQATGQGNGGNSMWGNWLRAVAVGVAIWAGTPTFLFASNTSLEVRFDRAISGAATHFDLKALHDLPGFVRGEAGEPALPRLTVFAAFTMETGAVLELSVWGRRLCGFGRHCPRWLPTRGPTVSAGIPARHRRTIRPRIVGTHRRLLHRRDRGRFMARR